MFIAVAISASFTILILVIIEILENRGYFKDTRSYLLHIIFGLSWLVFGLFVPIVSTPLGNGQSKIYIFMFGLLMVVFGCIKWLKEKISIGA